MTYWPADNPGGRRRQIGLADGACAILTCGPQLLCLCFHETLAAALASANRLTLVILLNEAGLLDCGYNFLA
jgi:hypothetical protein